MHITLDHIVLEVRDVESTAAFYERVLGLEPVRLAEFRAGEAPFVSGRVSGETLVDYFPHDFWRDKARPQNPNHFCFTVSRREVANLRRRLARRGIPITRQSKRNFGAQGWGVSLYFDDPDGVSVEVRYYRHNG